MNKTENENVRYWVRFPNLDHNTTADVEQALLSFDGEYHILSNSFKTRDKESAISAAKYITRIFQKHQINLDDFGLSAITITTQPYCKKCGYLGRFSDDFCPSCGIELEPSEDVDF